LHDALGDIIANMGGLFFATKIVNEIEIVLFVTKNSIKIK
jgi:hypothetical protein